MQAAAIVCRSCGAPYPGDPGSDALQCRHCGIRTPLDPSTRARLARHVAGVRRASEKARCILREQILAALLPVFLFRAKVYLFGSLVILFVVAPLLGAASMVPFIMSETADGDSATMWVVLGFGLAGLGLALAGIAFPVGLLLAFREGKNVDMKAARSARSASAFVDALIPVQCPACGGHAQVAVLGSSTSPPCPWCGTALVTQSADAGKLAADAILAAQRQTSDDALRKARVRAGLAPGSKMRLQIPGFTLSGGVYEGSVHGIPVWIAFDLKQGGMHRRIEVERPTRLAGAAWFVRRGGESDHAQALQEEGAPVWAQVATDPEIDGACAVFAEPGVDAAGLVRVAAVRQWVTSLRPGESVRFDPAGASAWRLSGPLMGASVADIVARCDALVRAAWELG